MDLTSLNAISPIDGRYRDKVEHLSNYFSEYGFMKYRVLVEIEYFIELTNLNLPQLGILSNEEKLSLRNIYLKFTENDALKIKLHEKKTNHDVKAVEYFLKEKLIELGLDSKTEFIHFGLTSQDINNTAIPFSIKHFLNEIYFPEINQLINKLEYIAGKWSDIPMLARTHGQPASPTRVGKEILVFSERLKNQLSLLHQVPHSSKFGGATGNFNAHHVSYPEIDWISFANKLVNDNLGLSRSQYTTQIENYDNLAALFDGLSRINTILIDFCRDVWTYISMEYFKQQVIDGEVGSSAMPHKVNPIDFENAEGNLGIANAIFSHLSSKLPISRLQRDLTDSTVLRNVGVPMSHTMISFKSISKGISKLIINENPIISDLENNWAVVAEAIQTILRREGYPSPYEKLKELTRGAQITKDIISEFISKLDISEKVKLELKNITPFNYTGI